MKIRGAGGRPKEVDAAAIDDPTQNAAGHARNLGGHWWAVLRSIDKRISMVLAHSVGKTWPSRSCFYVFKTTNEMQKFSKTTLLLVAGSSSTRQENIQPLWWPNEHQIWAMLRPKYQLQMRPEFLPLRKAETTTKQLAIHLVEAKGLFLLLPVLASLTFAAFTCYQGRD